MVSSEHLDPVIANDQVSDPDPSNHRLDHLRLHPVVVFLQEVLDQTPRLGRADRERLPGRPAVE